MKYPKREVFKTTSNASLGDFLGNREMYNTYATVKSMISFRDFDSFTISSLALATELTVRKRRLEACWSLSRRILTNPEVIMEISSPEESSIEEFLSIVNKHLVG